MHGERRWIETNPLVPVYKGRDGRRSGIITFLEGEDEGSRPMRLEGDACVQALEVEGPRLTALGAVCACTSPRSRRSNGFGIIIAKTRGACVIAII
jgi:superfamily II DNA helicase RecQ